MATSRTVASAFPTQAVSADVRPETVITTTIYPSATSSAAPPPSSQASDVPIAAIAGGAAAGVLLAIAAVLLWQWWGRSIQRKEDEEAKEAFAFLQLRENTRRNASTLMQNYTSYRPVASRRGRGDRKVKFAAHGKRKADEKSINEKICPDEDRSSWNEPKATLRPRPSPVSTPSTPPWLMRPPVARHAPERQPSDEAQPAEQTAEQISGEALSASHMLAHKGSTVSSASAYSTQSGEEHQVRAPSSLILAALGRLDPRRPLSSTYRRSARHSVATLDDLNRLSQISTGSVYLQIPEEATGTQVGLAK